MPIYEYLCPDGHRFEVVQRFSDEPVTLCEVCGKRVQRVLFAPAVHYKGKGFYATDYGRKGANGAKPDSSSSDSGGSEAGSKADSKSSDSKGSESKSSDSKSSDSKSSGGEGSSSKKSDSSSKPAA